MTADVLARVHPDLIARLEKVYAAMVDLGAPMKPVTGCRTTGEQALLWAKGRFGAPGPIVTNCDGIQRKSNHQVREDGYGHAVDSCFVGPDPYLTSHKNGALLWAAFGACCEAVGLIWGGRFTSLVDKPHAEWP